MNYSHLKYFAEVYKTHNISTAADNLYISRQGISKVIRAMERELGQSLFSRGSGGIYPTEFAHRIAPHVQRILKEYECIESLNSFAENDKGRASVYCFSGVPSYLGVEFMRSIHEKNPDICISFTEAPDDIILSKLEEHSCDFAISYGPIDRSKFDCTELFFSRFCVRMRKEHPLAGKKYLLPSDLDGEKLAGNGRAYRCFREAVQINLLSSGYKIQVPFETSDEYILSQLAREGLALVTCYDFQIPKLSDGLETKYFADDNLGSSFYLVENKGESLSPAAKCFKQFILNRFSK